MDTERAGLYCVWGLAVLGLAVANIPGFALVWAAADIPAIQAPLTGWMSALAWWISQTFFSWTFNLLFVFAFGGWLAWTVQPGTPRQAGPGRYLLWLLPAGLLHGYVFWYGDILVVMALAGMMVVAAQGLSLRARLVTGVSLVALTALMTVAGAGMLALLPGSMDVADALGFPDSRLADIEAAYRGGFLARLPNNLAMVLQYELIQIVFLGGGVAGLMLLGGAAVESGFLTAKWPPRLYVAICAAGLGAGLPLCGWSALNAMTSGFAPDVVWQSVAAQTAGSLCVALGYAAGVMLAIQQGVAKFALRLLANAGSLWLTHYLVQTLVFSLVFYGLPGLNLFGRVDQAGLLLLALVLVATQLGFTLYWSARYRYGPAEWVLYSLARGRRLPLGHASASR